MLVDASSLLLHGEAAIEVKLGFEISIGACLDFFLLTQCLVSKFRCVLGSEICILCYNL